MKRSESLELLHDWAKDPTPYPIEMSDSVREAQRHGLAAVRAIREAIVDPESDAYAGYVDVREARLAVRAALRACGIQGAL